MFTGLLIGCRKKVKFQGIFRDRFAEKLADFTGIFGANFAEKQSEHNLPLRARRCDPWGRQCDQLLLSGDQIFTPGRQPGPQDR